MEALDFKGTLSSSAYTFGTSGATYLTGSIEYRGETIPVYLWNAGTPIPSSFVTQVGEERTKTGEKGAMFISPTPVTEENRDTFKKYGFVYYTLDGIEEKLRAKAQETNELIKRIETEKKALLNAGGYSKSKEYAKYIASVDAARDTKSKKIALENFIAFFAQDVNLIDVDVDKKTPSSEIDVYAKNEQITCVWKELGTPVIFEAKNWDDHVNADQIRNLALKATGSKTRFMVAWNGISGKDETKGARLEIIKAKERGVFIIVLTKIDFEMIAGGVSPEKVIAQRYYSLIDDKMIEFVAER
jgi:hypothetical protein